MPRRLKTKQNKTKQNKTKQKLQRGQYSWNGKSKRRTVGDKWGPELLTMFALSGLWFLFWVKERTTEYTGT